MEKENQHTEWKSNWRDEYLKWICGFANANGGKLAIGINDEGRVIGIRNHRKLLEDLPNKIRDILGLMVDVNLHVEKNKYYIEILVGSYSTPISYQGQFYYRSGSTLQNLKGPALEQLLLRKIGKKWDGVTASDFDFNDLSPLAFEIFKNKAQNSQRIPNEDLEESNEKLVQLLGLTNKDELKRAAVIAFGKKPEQLVTGAYVKIGFFRSHAELVYQDEIYGSLFEQVEKTMDLLLTKYMKAYISYEGISRTETFNFPEEALREAVLNALIHKDYSDCNPIQISVYEDWLMIYNDGHLPSEWTMETLKSKHNSRPPNPDIARIFFRAGYIESWGRGTVNMVKYCKQAGLPEPIFEDKWGGLAVIFTKKEGVKPWENDIINKTISQKSSQEGSQEGSQKSSHKILVLVQENRNITTTEMARSIGISRRAVAKQISKLKSEGKLMRVGSNKGGHWKVLDNT